jgi:hypothetical protein
MNLTGNTLRLRYKTQPVNSVWGNIHYLLLEPYGHTDTLCGQNVEFVHHRKHITSPIQSLTGYCCLGKDSLFIVRTIRTHIYTVWAECRVCTSQETYYVSNTKPNRLLLFGKMVTIYCENHTNKQIHCVGRM